ncbi:GNAT family N-acetyltransferase [Glycomyces luteolus]|uniref:GNAT family N-acetyltransferase n=1 Tax=Glycomyces luteolus TaxID=2670330 RepID=A0A9X3P646_9ACTN|nr:GNAT family N-acetyltransferase [Glycomyces luteolus]MDA1359376.1 GNAT family N-acetyltransferase [Glycomyces luteolus]
MAGPVIAPAEPADAGEILTLSRAAYVSEAQLNGDPFIPPLTETVEEVAAQIDAVHVLKAVWNGRIVGAGRARQEGDVLHLGRIVVAPDLQGRGIGSRLIAALEGLAAHGTAHLALFTGAKSESNLRLYRRLGYTESHRAPGGPGVELVHLRKPAGRA